MDKIRIIIFGVTDKSIKIVQNELSLENIELVAYADNDIDKCDVLIDGIPVVYSKEIIGYEFDYILVSAWRSFDHIKEQLVTLGIQSDKIDLLYTEKISYWYPGIVYVRDRVMVQKIYRRSKLLLDHIKDKEKTVRLWKNYSTWEPMKDDKNVWCCKGTMIAHACGGMVNGIRREYSNSKEALSYSLQKGFRLIECDVYGIINGEIVLAHDSADIYDGCQGAYSLQTIRELLTTLKNDSDVTVLLDIKWESMDDYREIVDAIDSLVDEKQKNQIVLEVYDEPTIICAKEKGYECFFTQYRNPEWECFIKTIDLCYKYDIKAVGFQLDIALAAISSYFKFFIEKNIKIFVFSTDSIDDYAMLKSKGVSGVFTNYLVENSKLLSL